MTQLYECDNCGNVKQAIKKILKDADPNPRIKPVGKETTDRKYHVCHDCWKELGWGT